MDTADFQTVTTPRAVAPMKFEATVPDGWQQGRGAFGGLVIANLIRALEASAAEPGRTLRSLTAELCGPVLPGPAAISVEVLRRGSNVTTLAARITQGGEVQAQAVGVFGKARADRPRRTFVTPPQLPPWRDVPSMPYFDFVPTFARNWDLRCTGPIPFSGSQEPIAAGWVKPRNPGAARDAAYVAACADCWWPVVFSLEPGPRPVATISYTLELVGTCEGLDPEAPFFHRATLLAEQDGYTVEFRELWGEDGRLLALNQQTIAVIR